VGFTGQNIDGEEKGAIVRGTKAVGARGWGLYIRGYQELSEGRGVL
jgi:hypothetical protein